MFASLNRVLMSVMSDNGWLVDRFRCTLAGLGDPGFGFEGSQLFGFNLLEKPMKYAFKKTGFIIFLLGPIINL